jgi:ribosome biogenesis GTPase / thiamine phosphate phosphatase
MADAKFIAAADTNETPGSIKALGWNEFFANAYTRAISILPKTKRDDRKLLPGRVIRGYGQVFRIVTAEKEISGRLSGRLKHDASNSRDLPAVGDWVVCEMRETHDKPSQGKKASEALILARLERKNTLKRMGVLGRIIGRDGGAQILAANVDNVLVVVSVATPLQPRRIERFLTIAWASGARPILVFNKADLCAGIDSVLEEGRKIAPAVEQVAISALDEASTSELLKLIHPGSTSVLVGLSGVGKTTIVNTLLTHERFETHTVRASDRGGRHSSVRRELVLLPSGGIIIDTPGLRELAFCDGENSLNSTFSDIEALSNDCRFRDCSHQNEQDCAVLKAISENRLDSARLLGFRSQQAEIRKTQSARAKLEKLSRDIQGRKRLARREIENDKEDKDEENDGRNERDGGQ